MTLADLDRFLADRDDRIGWRRYEFPDGTSAQLINRDGTWDLAVIGPRDAYGQDALSESALVEELSRFAAAWPLNA